VLDGLAAGAASRPPREPATVEDLHHGQLNLQLLLGQLHLHHLAKQQLQLGNTSRSIKYFAKI
jgi:hypothetical protein